MKKLAKFLAWIVLCQLVYGAFADMQGSSYMKWCIALSITAFLFIWTTILSFKATKPLKSNNYDYSRWTKNK